MRLVPLQKNVTEGSVANEAAYKSYTNPYEKPKSPAKAQCKAPYGTLSISLES